MDDLTPDPPELALQQVEEEDDDVAIFTVEECAAAFAGYLQNMLNHVEPVHGLPLMIRLNGMLQEKAKLLSEQPTHPREG